MRPLPPKFFGPSGLPCVFTLDDETGATAVGYLVKQVGTRRFVVSDGSVRRTVTLTRDLDDVADLTSFPPATCTILITLLDDTVEHIQYLTEFRCVTIQGTSIGWHTSAATSTIGTISIPVLDSGDHEILLEDGSFWLLESGAEWDLNDVSYLLLFEDNDPMELEDDSGELLLQDAP